MYFELLSEDETLQIMSVLHQSVKGRPPITEAHKIMVWFSEIANRILKSNTDPRGYCVQPKLASKASEHQQEFIEILWDRGLVAIEIVRNNGMCGFYALPKAEVMKCDLSQVIILPAGEDPNEGVSLQDFYTS